MFDSAWGKRVSGFAAPAVMAILLCIALITMALCAALPKVQLAHADTSQYYRIWWDEYNVEGGSFTVFDQNGTALSPDTMIEEGTTITVAISPNEGKVLNLALAYSGDIYSEDARVESSLTDNTLTFVMPSNPYPFIARLQTRPIP